MRRNSRGQGPIWPYLAILACLFVLSVSAPRAWDRMRREETLSHALTTRRPASLFPKHAERARGSAANETVESTRTTRRAEEAPAETPAISPSVAETSPAAELADLIRDVRTDIAVLDQPGLPAPEAAADAPPAEAAIAQESPAQDPPAEIEIASQPKLPVAAETAAREDAPEPPAPDAAWPRPRVLIDQLTRLTAAGRGVPWANEALDLVEQLLQTSSTNLDARERILKQLRALSDRTSRGATPTETSEARAQYTLHRWVDIWESTAAWERTTPAASPSKKTAQRVRKCVDQVESLLSRKADGSGWGEYFKLDALRQATAEGVGEPARRAIARKVLDRMVSTRLTMSQMKFANEGPMAALKTQLRVWATEPVTAAQLLAHLEEYEQTGLPSVARVVANDIRAISWASPAAAEQISERLDTHYRNANLRIAATAALLNRLVPQPERMDAPVSDTVLNVPVYGNSSTMTRLTVQLIPDQQRIRLALVAKGLVDSNTVATSGPATFRSQGKSTFVVRKLIVIGPYGLSVWPAVAEADNSYNYLQSLETDYDGMPLVGSFVRNMALSRHQESQWQARSEVEYKVATRAREQLEREVQPQLMKTAENIEKKELALLDHLGLEVMPIGYSTTEDRVSARMRLSTPEQLGGHTPRPRAPSDSWYSVQLHESAINNGIEQLGLNGRAFELPDLFVWVGKKIDRPQMGKLDDLPEDVKMTFAKQDAVRVRCEGGRMEVILSFAELTQGRNRWHDFTVRTAYKPEPRKSEAVFVRDDTIHLEGRSLKGKPQVLLRTIFSKVLSINRPITMLGEKITADPRIQDLGLVQFAVDDGWIAIAYSGRQQPTNMVRRPK